MSDSNITLDLKGLSEPATKLIESVSKGIGGLWAPVGKILDAKATASASLILAQGEIEKQQLLSRAAYRMAHVEGRRQVNIESITQLAMAQLPESVDKEPVSEDWMVHFFESCKDVGEKELQMLWARLLAGEVAKPQTFSRRTLALLKTFEPQDAQAFAEYCGVSFVDLFDSHFAFLCQGTRSVLAQRIQRTDIDSHLASLGLVNAEKTFLTGLDLRCWKFSYFGERFSATYKGIVFAGRDHNYPTVAEIRRFTSVGDELARIASPSKIPHFANSLVPEFAMRDIEIVPDPEV